ncbi:hypothetical protein HGA64_04625 [Candidatus Falkowbacteria bacterium]|nr:hypothetical protein [Candidatus Falkowbacteria bacterium]
MLDKLFGSKTRVKLLKLFLLSPNRRLTLTDVVKATKMQLIPVKKELDNLEKFGLVETILSNEIVESGEELPEAAEGKNGKERKYYQLNHQFVLIEELKAVVIKSQVLYEREFIEKITKLGRIKLLVLSGIFANNPDSPIDLLVVGRLNKAKLVTILSQLEQELGKEINFTFMDPTEFVYRRGMTDVFLYQVLEGKKIVLIDEFSI